MRNPACQLCPLHEHAKTVCLWGTGPKTTGLMLVGEAPGANEDEQGEPFVGRAGELLNEALEHVGLLREEVYITNAVKCRPPDNRTPKKTEYQACSTYFEQELATVKPLVVMPLGNTALTAVTGETQITRWRGRTIYWAPWGEGDTFDYPTCIPTFHPAGVLRNPRWKRLFLQDFETVADLMLNAAGSTDTPLLGLLEDDA